MTRRARQKQRPAVRAPEVVLVGPEKDDPAAMAKLAELLDELLKRVEREHPLTD